MEPVEHNCQKKRILLDDANNQQCQVWATPMAAYYVSRRPNSSAGTLVSSLTSQSWSTVAKRELDDAADEKIDKMPTDVEEEDGWGNLEYTQIQTGWTPAVSIETDMVEVQCKENSPARAAQLRIEVGASIEDGGYAMYKY
jgi:hypothetical protein